MDQKAVSQEDKIGVFFKMFSNRVTEAEEQEEKEEKEKEENTYIVKLFFSPEQSAEIKKQIEIIKQTSNFIFEQWNYMLERKKPFSSETVEELFTALKVFEGKFLAIKNS